MARHTLAAAKPSASKVWTSRQMADSQFQFEIVVVGGGPAGLAAACTAAESGCRVGLVEATPWLGGQIWRGEPLGAPASRRQLSSSRMAGPSAETPPLPEAWLSRFLN